MTDFLIKHFVENKSNTNNRHKYGILSGVVGIICNATICIMKFIIGSVTLSISVTADAFNNLSDAISSIITLIGFKVSSRPADSKHPFGHGRIEYISGLVISIAIIMMGVEFIKSSIAEIINPETIVFDLLSVILLSVSCIVKFWLFLFNRKISQTIKSAAMKATAIDSMNDTIITLAVIVGMIITRFTGLDIDGYLGVVVALFIIYTGISTIGGTMSPLLGQRPDPEFVKEITDSVLNYDHIEGVHDLMVHNYGPSNSVISLHAEVPCYIDIMEIHDIIDQIERDLKIKFGCEIIIHMDPIATDDVKIIDLKKKVEHIVKVLGPSVTIHDFRTVDENNFTVLVFDVVIPDNFRLSDDEIVLVLNQGVKALNERFVVKINIDKNHT